MSGLLPVLLLFFFMFVIIAFIGGVIYYNQKPPETTAATEDIPEKVPDYTFVQLISDSPHASISSRDGQFTGTMKTDGNFVITNKANDIIWQTGPYKPLDPIMFYAFTLDKEQSSLHVDVFFEDNYSIRIWNQNFDKKPETVNINSKGQLIVLDANNNQIWNSSSSYHQIENKVDTGSNVYTSTNSCDTDPTCIGYNYNKNDKTYSKISSLSSQYTDLMYDMYLKSNVYEEMNYTDSRLKAMYGQQVIGSSSFISNVHDVRTCAKYIVTDKVYNGYTFDELQEKCYGLKSNKSSFDTIIAPHFISGQKI
jgi:hypothetical protein